MKDFPQPVVLTPVLSANHWNISNKITSVFWEEEIEEAGAHLQSFYYQISVNSHADTITVSSWPHDISISPGSVCATKTNTIWLTFLWLWGLSVPWRQIQYGWHFCDSGVCLCHGDKYNMADIFVSSGSVSSWQVQSGVCLCHRNMYDVADIFVSLGSVSAIMTSTMWLTFCRSGVCLCHKDKHNLAVISHILGSACAIKYNAANISHSLGCVCTTKYNVANISVGLGSICAIVPTINADEKWGMVHLDLLESKAKNGQRCTAGSRKAVHPKQSLFTQCNVESTTNCVFTEHSFQRHWPGNRLGKQKPGTPSLSGASKVRFQPRQIDV